MRLPFDPNQGYQLDAVAAVVDLFDGQVRGAPEFSVIKSGTLLGSLEMTDTGLGNRLLLPDERLRENARKVQERNDIEFVQAGRMRYKVLRVGGRGMPCPYPWRSWSSCWMVWSSSVVRFQRVAMASSISRPTAASGLPIERFGIFEQLDASTRVGLRPWAGIYVGAWHAVPLHNPARIEA